MTVQFVNEYTAEERNLLETIFKNAVRDLRAYHSRFCGQPCEECPVKRLCDDMSRGAVYLADYDNLQLFKLDKEKVTK